jgi:hypothetical protein
LRTKLLTLPLASAAALALGAAVPAMADAPASTPLVSYSGLFDGYYAYDFYNPTTSNTISARAYDFRHNTPTLALGEVNAWHTAKPGGFGFKTTIGAGDIADANGHVNGFNNGTSESQFKSLMQAYVTYAGTGGWGADLGKFYTPIGYEVTESNGNMNETHSVPFNTIPFYHAGLRVYSPSIHGFVFTGYVVNAVYDAPKTPAVGGAGVENNAGTASFVGNVIWTDPKGKWVIGDSFGTGKNKFNLSLGPDPTKNQVTVNDTDVTYNFDATNIGGLNYTYAQTKPDNTSDSTKATDNAWAAYYKHVLNPTSDVALRYSGGTFKVDGASPDAKPWEVTATFEKHPASNFLYRVEYQHMGSNTASFANKDGVLKKSQDVIELAGIFTFAG